MSSVVLSKNVNSTLDGLNLMWAINGMGAVIENTLIYYVNSADADIQSLDVKPTDDKLNLMLESGRSYSFQLQITDVNGLTLYSNILVATSPYILAAPTIASYVGRDSALDLVVQANGNTLSSQDTVEFVLKNPSNQVFWIIKQFQSSGNYTLSVEDNALLVNNQSYRVACMFQPSLSNALYSSPSAMSNSLSAMPSNTPNAIAKPTVQSVGVATPALRTTWNRPSDFAEWSEDFSIVIRLFNYVSGATQEVELVNQNVVEYTFTDLNRNDPYEIRELFYRNQFGDGVSAPGSDSIVLTTRPDAPTLVDALEGDGEMTLNWLPPAYTGNSAITGYKLYKQAVGNNPSPVINLGNVLTYTDTSLPNGIQHNYYVVAVNAIGDSPVSNTKSGIPFGECQILNVVVNAKSMAITINPNGRAIDNVYVVALDANPSHADDPSQFVYQVPANAISTSISQSFTLSKAFTNFSDDISFWAVIINNEVSNAFLKSA